LRFFNAYKLTETSPTPSRASVAGSATECGGLGGLGGLGPALAGAVEIITQDRREIATNRIFNFLNNFSILSYPAPFLNLSRIIIRIISQLSSVFLKRFEQS